MQSCFLRRLRTPPLLKLDIIAAADDEFEKIASTMH